MKDFAALCDRLQTDKGRYARFYEDISDDFRFSVKKILEIGTAGGSSLRLWEIFFPNAKIYGIDNDPGRIKDKNPSWTLGHMIQEDAGAVKAFAEAFGPWDVIVDDASHQVPKLMVSWAILRPRARLFIAEDMSNEQVLECPVGSRVFNFGHENILTWGGEDAFNQVEEREGVSQ